MGRSAREMAEREVGTSEDKVKNPGRPMGQRRLPDIGPNRPSRKTKKGEKD